MGGSPSIQVPVCECSRIDDLPYKVYEAAEKGHLSIISQYLREKGHVNATYKQETMLHAACKNGRENVVHFLLHKKSLCVNLRNGYNATALMLAAENGYLECVKHLLANNSTCKIELSCKNNEEHTAADIAHLSNHQEVAYYLTSFLQKTPPYTHSQCDSSAKMPTK
ncbi:cortactin-binding protein 2-like isoform X3 [Portunus trituberculatus]|uniref:cortactin-binding protein 2-like isoform X3 n=1 Tax=Portunus trituberculatus TaxID=210409 RepID=UPI001E1CBEC7|nr:cortactin-binding protein 2-like isoform X3 [Portunus trituberculatus]